MYLNRDRLTIVQLGHCPRALWPKVSPLLETQTYWRPGRFNFSSPPCSTTNYPSTEQLWFAPFNNSAQQHVSQNSANRTTLSPLNNNCASPAQLVLPVPAPVTEIYLANIYTVLQGSSFTINKGM